MTHQHTEWHQIIKQQAERQKLEVVATDCRLIGEKADVVLESVEPTLTGFVMCGKVRGHSFTLEQKLFGRFNAENICLAIGIALGLGHAPENIIFSADYLTPVVGRMDLVAKYNGATIFVDYAHTPDALEAVLREARKITRGCVGVVFGCGGDRDVNKRLGMGTVAEETADLVVVTDDNPRFEDAASIRGEILTACSKAVEIANRREAITYAVHQLQRHDLLVIAGKGHETTQQIGRRQIPFSDKEVVLSVLPR